MSIRDYLTSPRFKQMWENTNAAADVAPLPRGTYVARLTRCEAIDSAAHTPGLKLTFRVLEGEHAGRMFWHTAWLSEKAMPFAKRDLAKLGIDLAAVLAGQNPTGQIVRADLTVRENDQGGQYNQLRRFDVIGRESVDDPDFGPAAEDAVSATATKEVTV